MHQNQKYSAVCGLRNTSYFTGRLARLVRRKWLVKNGVEVDLPSGDMGRVHRVREVTDDAGARVTAQKVRTK